MLVLASALFPTDAIDIAADVAASTVVFVTVPTHWSIQRCTLVIVAASLHFTRSVDTAASRVVVAILTVVVEGILQASVPTSTLFLGAFS